MVDDPWGVGSQRAETAPTAKTSNTNANTQTQSSPGRGYDLRRSTAPGSRASWRADRKQTNTEIPAVSLRGGLRDERVVVERGRVRVEGEAVRLQVDDGLVVAREDAVHEAAGLDRKSTRLNSSHSGESRMPSSA